MSQAKKKQLNAAIVLTIIAIVAAIALAVVYNVTAGTIQANEAAKLEAAYGKVMPGKYTPIALPAGHKDAVLYSARNDAGELVGYCVTTKAKGYSGGEVAVTLGVNAEGIVQGCIVDASTQTSGFGSKCGEESFTKNFIDMDLMGDGVFPAVSGATVTSKAVLAATNEAADCVSFAIKQQEIAGDNIAFGEKAGAAVAETKEASAKGFMGDVKVTVGFAEDSKIATVEYDVSGETPEYGGRYATAEGDAFKESLIGLELPVDVDGLSGATFTGNAIKTAINSMKPADTAAGIDWTNVEYTDFDDISEAGVLGGYAVIIPGEEENGTVTVNVTIVDGVVTGVTYVEAAAPAVAETKTAKARGYVGDVTVTVGFDADGKIATVEYDVSGETPNFGGRYATSEGNAFKSKLIGKELPVDVDGLSGATYTGNAIKTAINSMNSTSAPAETPKAAEPDFDGLNVKQASAIGYEESVKVKVGFDANGAVAALIIDDSGEHPGIPSDAAQEAFAAQFIGKTGPFIVGETKEGFATVEGVSGATWTCKGAVEAINKVIPEVVPAPAAVETAPIVTGIEFEASANGYQQLPVNVKVTFNADGTVASLVVDASSQTAAFGGKCADEAFTSQFIGKAAPFTVGGNIDGISNATMTAKAVCEAINSIDPTVAPAVTLEASANGYKDLPVNVKVTFNADGTVAALEVDASSQTAAFGGKCADEAFTSQFIGKAAPFTVGVNIDGSTNATMTSKAVCEAVNSVAPAAAPAETAAPAEADAPADAAPATAVTKEASAKGFQSDVKVTVGFTADGKIAAVEYDVSGETSGFGTRYATAEGDAFKASLIGKELPVDVDGLSGATYTGNAIKSAINSIKLEEAAAADTKEASAKGFQSDVKVTVSFTADGKIAAVEYDVSGETSGFGTRYATAEGDAFKASLIGKELPVDVDGLSGATYTGNAIKTAINSLAK